MLNGIIKVDHLISLAYAGGFRGMDYYNVLVNGKQFGTAEISVVEDSTDAEVIEQFEIQTKVVVL